MKAFLAGLLFLSAIGLVIGLCFLLLPILLVMGFILRVILLFILVIGGIWLLGKLIIFIWEKLKTRPGPRL